MALSGVMIRMPLVCCSMVASAFQYGWAPTLMPATMMLISPPSWVNVMIRRSALATPSMFSVPLSIEIFAPEDRVNHSTGTPSSSARSMRGHHDRALGDRHRAERLGRVAEQRDPGDALRVPGGRRGDHARRPRRPCSARPAGRPGRTSPSAKSYSVKRARAAPVSIGTISYGYAVPRAPDRCTFWVYSSSGASASVGGSVTVTVTPGAGLVGEAQRHVAQRPVGLPQPGQHADLGQPGARASAAR